MGHEGSRQAGARPADARARLAVTLMLTALAGCGGGGGDGSADAGTRAPAPAPAPVPAPAPAPGPSLSVTAQATTVTAGAAPVALHATLQGSTDTITWTLSGPGSLSAASGADVQYTPPDSESLDAPAAASISAATSSALTQQVQIQLQPAVIAGHHWTIARAAGREWQKVAYGNGRFVAVDNQGALYDSVDASHWTAHPWSDPDVSYIDVSWGPAGWVALDTAGDTMISPDGQTWTTHKGVIDYDTASNRIIASGQLYLAYSGAGTRVSSDGIHWSNATSQVAFAAYGNGEFMGLVTTDPATNNGWTTAPYASTDGLNWLPVANVQARQIAFRQTDFVANMDDTLYSSADGTNWSSSYEPGLLGDGAIAYAGHALFGFGGTSMAVLLDGQSAQPAVVPDILSVPVSVAYSGSKYVGVSPMGWVSTSTDAIHWSTALEGSVGDLTAVDYFNGHFVAMSNNDWVLNSTDGSTWARSVVPQLPHSLSPHFNAGALAHNTGVLVAVGGVPFGATQKGWWLRSTDGQTWATPTTPPPDYRLNDVTYDGHRFVAVDAVGNVYESTDGDTWDELTEVIGQPVLSDIAYGNGVYVAVGTDEDDHGVIVNSSDTIHWSVCAPVASTSDSHVTAARMSGVTWDGTRFIAVGRDGVSATSSDGRTWTAGQLGVVATRVIAANGEIVAAGPGAVMSSLDGLHWHTRVSGPTGTSGAIALVHAQGRFLGVGPRSVIISSSN